MLEQMDALVLSGVLMGIATVIGIIFYFFSPGDEEREFEKAFNEDARKLLNKSAQPERAEKPKLKHKSAGGKKKDKDREHKKIEKEDHSEKEDGGASERATSSEEREEIITSANSATAREEAAQIEMAEKENVHPIGRSEKEPDNKETSISANENNGLGQAEQTESPGKEKEAKRRKKKAKRETDQAGEGQNAQTQQSVVSEPRVEKVNAHQTQQAIAAPAQPQNEGKKKKKQTAFVRPSELDADKVLTRLAGVEEIEPEYIGFLVTYFHEASAASNELRSKLNAKTDSETELATRLEEAKQARLSFERQAHDKERKLQEAGAKLSATQYVVEQLHAQSEQLRLENEGLKKAVNSASAGAAEAARKQADLDKLKQKETSLTRRVSQLEAELKQQQLQNVELQKASEDSFELNKVQTEFEKLEKIARELKTQLEEKSTALEKLRAQAQDSASLANSNATNAGELLRAAQADRDALHGEFETAKIEWEKKESALMTEYHSLQSLVDELNKEVAKFETFKKEQEVLEQQLRAKEKELVEKSAKLREAESLIYVPTPDQDKLASLEKVNAELRRELDAMSKRLAEAEKREQEYKQQTKENGRGVEEEIVLKKQAGLNAAAPSGASSTGRDAEELTKLKDENNRLKAKNDELRERNRKILEQVNSAEAPPSHNKAAPPTHNGKEIEEKLLEERRLVVEILGPLSKAHSNHSKLADTTAYAAWLRDTAGNLHKELQDSRRGKDKEVVKKSTPPPAVAENSKEVKVYKDALSALTGELSRIETLYAESQHRYESRIAELEHKLGRALHVVSTVHQLKCELKQCQQIKRQIVDLKTCLTSAGTSPLSSPLTASPPPVSSSAKSDDGEWEVVSS